MPYSTSRSTGSLFALAFVLGACAPEDDPNYQNPSFPATTGDAQVVVNSNPPVVGSAGQDAGASAPAAMDAWVPMVTMPAPDAQMGMGLPPVVVGEAGALEGGVILGDAAVDGGRPSRMDLGKGDGKDVITIGDSWMLLFFTGIQESLTTVAMQPYRKYGVPGTRMLSGEIPGQYTSAKRADPDIKTVVMTGGGNDIIQDTAIKNDCTTGGSLCKAQLDKIGKSLSDLWAQMSKDGVQDVIHVMYSSSAGDPIKDREANNKALVDACAAVPPPLRCHLLNTDMIITRMDLSDGIHPDAAGYDRIGKAVFELMVKEGMRR